MRNGTGTRPRLALTLALLAAASSRAGAQPEGARPDTQTTSPERERVKAMMDALKAGTSAGPSGSPSASSEVSDAAKMFDQESVVKATDQLARSERATGVPVFIETVDDLGGDTIETVIARHARRRGKDGVYVLIDKKDRKFLLSLTGRYKDAVDKDRQLEIRDAFLTEFKAGRPDAGLGNGVKRIAGLLADAKAGGKLPAPGATGTLVARDRVRLTLAGARQIVAGAEAKAAEMKLLSNIAVVDDGGHLLAFARMDGARPASGYTAITKATSAATFRQETGPLPKGTATPDPHLNLGLQNAAAASGGKITTLYGGIPVVVDGQVIGAVGVGGGTGEQDAVVARAGVDRFQNELTPAHPGGDQPRAARGER